MSNLIWLVVREKQTMCFTMLPAWEKDSSTEVVPAFQKWSGHWTTASSGMRHIASNCTSYTHVRGLLPCLFLSAKEEINGPPQPLLMKTSIYKSILTLRLNLSTSRCPTLFGGTKHSSQLQCTVLAYHHYSNRIYWVPLDSIYNRNQFVWLVLMYHSNGGKGEASLMHRALLAVLNHLRLSQKWRGSRNFDHLSNLSVWQRLFLS